MKIPKLCPNCRALPMGCFSTGGKYIYMACPDCGQRTKMVHIGDASTGNYYQKASILYELAVALWNRKVVSARAK